MSLPRRRVASSGRATCCSARIEELPLLYLGGAQFELWKHTQLTIDAVPGRGGGFSLEAPRGQRFLTRSRVFDDREIAALEAADLRPRAG